MTRPVQMSLPAIGELAAEQARLKHLASKGTTCGACGRTYKIRRRRLDSLKARGLLGLVGVASRAGNSGGWVPLRDAYDAAGLSAYSTGGEVAKLALWELAEPLEEDGKRVRGMWRPTAGGWAFSRGTVVVPAWLDVLDGRIVELSTERVDIWTALGADFDLREVLRGAEEWADDRA